MLYMSWYMLGLVMCRVCVITFFCILCYDLERSHSSCVFGFIFAYERFDMRVVCTKYTFSAYSSACFSYIQLHTNVVSQTNPVQ